MPKKNLLLVFVLVVLSAIYVYFFTDWFNKPQIAISPRVRVSPVKRGGPDELQVSFSFDTKCELTEVKVFSVAEMETNKYPHALWHLISDTNSAPLKGILYGQAIAGMKPKIPKMKPEPLQPQRKYRLLVQAGELRGQTDFEIPVRRTVQ